LELSRASAADQKRLTGLSISRCARDEDSR
jgi:hypothetical protein